MLRQPFARRIGPGQHDAAARRGELAQGVVPRLGLAEGLGKHDPIDATTRSDVAVFRAREDLDLDPIPVQRTRHRQAPVVRLQDDRAG